VLDKQREDGGWGESYLSSEKKVSLGCVCVWGGGHMEMLLEELCVGVGWGVGGGCQAC
jgi:hypothetical protein